MLIIAHRGASAILPENTRTAFDRALEMGAHGLECDIQISADGQAVIFHDDTLDRTTNGTGRVDAHPMSTLKKLCVEEQETIINAKEFLDLYASVTTLWIEIKDPRTVGELCRLIEQRVKHGLATWDHCILISFDQAALLDIRARLPQAVIGLLLDDLLENGAFNTFITQARPTYILPNVDLATSAFIAEITQQNPQVIVWTLNEINEALRLQERGVSGIITDVPNILYELFHG